MRRPPSRPARARARHEIGEPDVDLGKIVGVELRQLGANADGIDDAAAGEHVFREAHPVMRLDDEERQRAAIEIARGGDVAAAPGAVEGDVDVGEFDCGHRAAGAAVVLVDDVPRAAAADDAEKVVRLFREDGGDRAARGQCLLLHVADRRVAAHDVEDGFGVEIGAPRGRRVLEDDLDARHFLGDRPVERGDRGGAGAEALRRLDHDRVDASDERAAGDAHHFAHICGTRAGDDRQLLCAGDHDLEKLVSFLCGKLVDFAREAWKDEAVDSCANREIDDPPHGPDRDRTVRRERRRQDRQNPAQQRFSPSLIHSVDLWLLSVDRSRGRKERQWPPLGCWPLRAVRAKLRHGLGDIDPGRAP